MVMKVAMKKIKLKNKIITINQKKNKKLNSEFRRIAKLMKLNK